MSLKWFRNTKIMYSTSKTFSALSVFMEGTRLYPRPFERILGSRINTKILYF